MINSKCFLKEMFMTRNELTAETAMADIELTF